MHKKLLVAVFSFMLLFFPIISLVLLPSGDKVFSENENRYLASFPALSLDRLMDRRFMKGFEAWASDMFVGREAWISVKNSTELLLGKTELDGVFINEKMLMQKWNDYDKEATDRTLAAMNDFAARAGGVPVYFMLVPTAQEIYPEYIPPNADIRSQRNYIKYCCDNLPNVNCIDVISALASHKDNYIYYRTDHHWTSLGAYFAYTASAARMNFSPVDIGDFNIEHASNSFLGTLFSKTLYSGTEPDTIDFYHLSAGDPKIKVEISDGVKTTEYDSLYFREFLEKKDKYGSFLSTNPPLTEITSAIVGNDKKLLIFKDSYANCLVPFYAKNYSKITVVDMRFINADYNSFVDVSEYDQILFVYNVITFSEDTNLVKLNMGK